MDVPNAATDFSKKHVVSQYAKGIWYVPMNYKMGNVSRVYNLLFSINGLEYTKWYRDLAESQEDSVTREATYNLIRIKADRIHAEFKDTSFVKSACTDLNYWIDFCDQFHSKDYAVYNDQSGHIKLRNFYEWRSKKALVNRNKDGKSNTNLIQETIYEVARNISWRIARLACYRGYYSNKNEIRNIEAVSVLLQRYRQEMVSAREKPRDFAGSSRMVVKRLTKAETKRLTETYWSGVVHEDRIHQKSAAHMRDFVLQMLNYSEGRRGMDVRGIRFGMLLTHHVEPLEPVDCTIIAASLRHVKECNMNEEHILAWMRTPDPIDCPIGSLSTYLVWILDIYKSPHLFHIMKRDFARQLTLSDSEKLGGMVESVFGVCI
jgi:hypothetical protein